MGNNNPSFRPVRLTEKMLSKISNTQNHDGYLYFTTDTQKIYMGMPDGEMLSMGGNTGVFYGNKEIEYPDDGNEPNPEVIFFLDHEDESNSEIEGNRLPQIDDLILNIDGCFYRVVDILDEVSVKTNRITLQGSGTGGGSGESEATLRIAAPNGTAKTYSSGTDSILIDVIAFSSDPSNYISIIECSFDKNFTDNFLIYNLFHPIEKIYEIDLISQKNKFSEIAKKVYVRVTDRYGVTRSLTYTITLAKLELSKLEDDILQATGASLIYRCLVGGSSGISERQLEYRFYSQDGSEIDEYAQFYKLEANQFNQIQKAIDVSKITHGSYELRVNLTGYVGNTLISSNILSHKIIRYDNEIGQPIFTYLLPDKFEQYTDIDIRYMLVYGDSQKSYIMDIDVNEESYASQSVVTSQIGEYTFNFDKAGSYKIEMKIADLNIDESFNINVEKYTGILPVINIDRDDLKVYLTAKGRTNSVADKEYWPDYKNPTMKATLSNFYYRNVNGWMVDNNKVNYLKATQGAQVLFNDYSPYEGEISKFGLTIELDFMINGVLDYDQNLIECLSLYSDNAIKTGFVVKGDNFKYYASGKELVSLNLVQGKRIKLSFVIEPTSETYPMCYTYLDGIISKVINYDTNYDFKNNPQNPGYLKINSTGGQVSIYNIRFYSSALDEPTILNNYQATLDSLDARQSSYESNLIRDLYGDINLAAIESEDYNLQIPYVKITGGYQADKSFTMSKKASNNTPNLPVGKKDYRSIDIEIIYPKKHQNAYFEKYKDFKVTTTFDDPALNVLNGFENTPIEGAIMYAQGTSSLEYPVKNLRVKLKGKKFTVRPDIAPVELVTFKADFMESSGSHNTGAANYIDDLYDSIGIATPGQKQFKDQNVGTIVTCIKGHPCVIFWNPGVDENGNELSRDSSNYKFIGKYNFNLDKATPEPFGFMHDEEDEDFGYTINENGEKVNSIYCFEFLDNNEKVCNFIHDPESTYIGYSVEDPDDKEYEINDKTEQERYYDSWYSKRKNEDGEIVHGWMRGFESRYPEDKDGLNDADVLYRLASWINDLYAMRYIDNKTEEAIQKFKDEYQGYLDKEFLLTYYLITEVLLMADSRVKNMMIATWGKETREWEIGPENNKVKKSVTDYIWYPIFYDMDTMLGLDNIGYVNKNYYDEDTDPKVFNGDEILWEFVRDGLKNELAEQYNDIEQSGAKSFTKAAIIPYFNDNQATMANETFYNEDAFYKYIDTFRNGYTDHLHDKYIEPGTGSRLYAAQGNRAMMREFFIENRIRYLRGKYLSTNYQEGDRIEFRLTYPTYVEVPNLPDEQLSDSQKEQKLINASIASVPPSGSFDYTSMKIGYAGVKVGTATQNYKFESPKIKKTLTVDTSSGNGTETYLYGISNLSDVGDLSNKYLYKLIVGTSENNLKQLILGNHHKDYFNPFWKNETSIELKGFTFLEKFSLENCGTFSGSINFTESPQIKTVFLTGSNVSALTLPIGGILEELRLPTSLTNLYIDSHPELTNEKFTLGYFDYDLDVYVNDFSKLVHVALIGVPQIDSYSLIRSALFNSDRLETFCFQDFNWIIDDANDLTYDENGYVNGIKVLDVLMGSTKAAYEGYSKAEALIGTLTINVPEVKINEFDIYQTYQFNCPNLIIQYGDDVELDEAVQIEFYNTDTLAEGTRPYYSVLSNGFYDLEYLTSISGPSGAKLPEPQKLSTNDKIFTFSGNWIVYSSNDTSIIVGSKINQDSFNNIVPKGDLKLIPEFNSFDRLYSVILYDYNETPLIEAELKYNTNIGEALVNNTKSYYNYRPYDGNKEHYRYEFKGWQSEYDFNNKTDVITYTSLNEKIVQSKLKLYAYYKEENCLTTVSNSDYFGYSGKSLYIQPKYKTILQGKITLPSKSEIFEIAGSMLEGNSNITDIYFLENAQYTKINDRAFYNCINLKNVFNLPDSIIEIGSLAFQSCNNLKLDKLPRALETIGTGAFAFNYELALDHLPENLIKISQSAFHTCRKLVIKEFGTNNSAPNLKTIEGTAFINAGDNITGNIILGKKLLDGESYLIIANKAFENYGKENEINVYINDSVSADPNKLGFIANEIIQGEFVL